MKADRNFQFHTPKVALTSSNTRYLYVLWHLIAAFTAVFGGDLLDISSDCKRQTSKMATVTQTMQEFADKDVAREAKAALGEGEGFWGGVERVIEWIRSKVGA